MKNRLWILQFPIIAFFTLCFIVTEAGERGDLNNALVREKVYPPLSRVNNVFTDWKFRIRGKRPFKNKIVVVEIDSVSLETIGRWPWHRDIMAILVEKIFKAGAKVVGLDIIFSEPDPRVPDGLKEFLDSKGYGILAKQAETDPILAEVIAKYSDRLVLGWTTEQLCQPAYDGAEFCPVEDPEALSLYPESYKKFSLGEFVAPHFQISKTPIVSFFSPIANIPAYNKVAGHAGYLNAFLDVDGYIRKTSLFVFAAGTPYPSLAFEMARVGLGERVRLELDEENRVQELSWAKSRVPLPVTPLGVMQINFRGPGSGFKHISALDVLTDSDTVEYSYSNVGEKVSEVLKDAYVFVGVSALGVFDMRQFPFESNAPGVDGHANILDNLLSVDPLTTGEGWAGYLLLIFVLTVGCFGMARAIERLDAVPALGLFLLIFVGLIFFDVVFAFSHNYNWNTSFLYLEITTIFILTLAAKYVLEEKNKKFIRGAFAKYVPPTVVDSILKDPAKLSLGGERRELTILFSDIRGFTTFSEQMDAKALSSFLNDYLGIMTQIIFENQGTLDKYIGDAIMAFWGAPLAQKEHAKFAVNAAAQMSKALKANHRRFMDEYGIDVKIGIGVNSGSVSVGNMGSEQNFAYTALGDHVNLASRLEGLTKEYGVALLTTRFTFDWIKKAGLTLPEHRVLDQVKVKGRKTAVELIQILDSEVSEEGIESFRQGREFYLQKKWDEAIAAFKRCNDILGETAGSVVSEKTKGQDGPSATYIARCEYFKQNPPQSDWDGSWEMTNK